VQDLVVLVHRLHLQLHEALGKLVPDGSQRGNGGLGLEAVDLTVAIRSGKEVSSPSGDFGEVKGGGEHKLRGIDIPEGSAVHSAGMGRAFLAVVFQKCFFCVVIHKVFLLGESQFYLSYHIFFLFSREGKGFMVECSAKMC
jgi:hypothetical protein